MANGHHNAPLIPPEDLPENNQRIWAYVFPRVTFTDLLEQQGFHDVGLQLQGEQVFTYNLQMTSAGAGLTVPDVRQQLVQTVAQIPANNGVAWRVVVSAVLIDGPTVHAQLVVAYLEHPR